MGNRENPDKNKMIHLSDSINKSMVGDPNALKESGCLTKIIFLIIIIAGLVIYSLFFN